MLLRRPARSLPALAAVLAGCGGHAATPASPLTTAGAGIRVRVPAGWHLLRPHVTALSYPVERLLLTSYAAPRGGSCAPDRAAAALPPGGALIYLIEYRPPGGRVWSAVHRSAFPPRPARFTLAGTGPSRLECWRVPAYLLRFRAADRPFQVHVVLGPRATAEQRARVVRVLDSLRIRPIPPPPQPVPGSAVTPRLLETALRTNPNDEARAASCTRTGRRRFACRIALPFHAPADFDVRVLPNGCFVGHRRGRDLADYGCVRR